MSTAQAGTRQLGLLLSFSQAPAAPAAPAEAAAEAEPAAVEAEASEGAAEAEESEDPSAVDEVCLGHGARGMGQTCLAGFVGNFLKRS